jgi:diguanylate cyclase (GGDEF)-like protein
LNCGYRGFNPASDTARPVSVRTQRTTLLHSLIYGQDAKQAVRLQRFFIATATYLMAIVLMAAGNALNLIEDRALVQTAVLSAAASLVFYALIRSGRNLHFQEPSLTLPQIVTANVVLMQAAYFAGPLRGLYLTMYLVIYVFGIFRLSTRQFAMLCAFSLVLYAAMIGLLMILRPETVDLRVEALQWLVLAGVLPWFAVVGGQISTLRQRLRTTNRDLEQSLQHIERIASRDDLTGLPNRVLFNQYLVHAIGQAKRNRDRLAVVFVDLDRFKNVNDGLGHDAGDQALREIAARLRANLRESDVVARLGGDEFVILIENIGKGACLDQVTQKILACCAEPLKLRGQEFIVSASLGVSLYPDDADDAAALMKNADIAMYRAKDRGRNAAELYSPQMRHDAERRLQMESALRRALERDEFVLHYQPKVAIDSGHITGFEALVRWRHPQSGLVGPDKFIAAAEENGLIVPLGEWVLRTACRQAALWHQSGLRTGKVAVNLSARQFRAKGLLNTIRDVMEQTGLPPSLLELEITESVVMQDPDQAARLLDDLRNAGITLALDDFGTGYSSLSYLKRFPFDHVKVDRSFIRNLPDDAEDCAITKAIVAMAHSLKLKVIAEGVEHVAQHEFLAQLGCDELQGYLISRPVPRDDMERLLREGDARSPGTAPFQVARSPGCA